MLIPLASLSNCHNRGKVSQGRMPEDKRGKQTGMIKTATRKECPKTESDE